MLFRSAAPNTFHQLIAGELYRQIANYIVEQDGACTPFISPVDVQLDNDEKTMLQPDIAIVCNPGQIVRRNIMGAPDFVLEVISPGSRRKDYIIKLHKYEDAGVREYWLVDPNQKVVLVYFFEDEACPIKMCIRDSSSTDKKRNQCFSEKRFCCKIDLLFRTKTQWICKFL